MDRNIFNRFYKKTRQPCPKPNQNFFFFNNYDIFKEKIKRIFGNIDKKKTRKKKSKILYKPFQQLIIYPNFNNISDESIRTKQRLLNNFIEN